MTTPHNSESEPLTGELIYADTPQSYWYVFGAPLADSKGASKNFPQVIYGPNPKAPDNTLAEMTFSGEHGETFRYLGSFTHDPTDEDLASLRPKAYK